MYFLIINHPAKFSLAIAIVIGFFLARLSWKTFYHFLSKRELYRTSKWELFSNRLSGAVAAFIFLGAMAFAFIYGILKNVADRFGLIYILLFPLLLVRLNICSIVDS